MASNLSVYELANRTFTRPEYGVMLPQNSWHVNCHDDPRENMGICDNWWVDDLRKDSYALFKLDDMEHNFYGLMRTIMGRGWASGEDLFVGSRACSDAVNFYSCRPDAKKQGKCRDSSAVMVGFPQVRPDTLASQCFSNLRVCGWEDYDNSGRYRGDDYVAGIGREFAENSGCAFAWSNLCIDDSGLGVDADNATKTSSWHLITTTDHYDQSLFPNDTESLRRYLLRNNSYMNDVRQYYIQNVNRGVGTASVRSQDGVIVQAMSSTYGRTLDNRGATISLTGRKHKRDTSPPLSGELLAFNSLYDLFNTPADVLRAQATQMDPKKCKEYPKDGKRPGWGGAGYHVHAQQCKRWPASYLGPGLYFDTEFCGPLG